MKTEDIQACSAGVVGLFATVAGGWVDNLGSLLDVFVRLGQIGVAVVTILYIYSKWKAARAPKKDDTDDPS